MKSLQAEAGFKNRTKFDTQMGKGRYWATMGKEGNRFRRSDGSIGSDKTIGLHSRPGSKATARQANRALNKSARRALKKRMQDEAHET